MGKRMDTNKNIVFIGMPGCGKSSIGKIVAERLKLPFYDVDEYIEKKAGKTIKEIFQHGEEHFRRIESEAIREISQNRPSVISTGGGAVKVPLNMKILRENSVIFFINRPIEKILQDIDISVRPLLAGDASKIYELYQERYPLYKKYCDIEVMNDREFQDVVNKIIRFLGKMLYDGLE
ncbi:shikimate kinase [Fonticella tunisiensis]|uniref:Shikimate kinase n=1 Tax=Fonticella tunisiensis TaxID=1096341 RepID=A0A4R7KAH1_9CLOT|nr:shikimate kinase [Fonticella tunisiensis]TDT51374.1 shikimate kinase [Fonticella tunisiensis]